MAQQSQFPPYHTPAPPPVQTAGINDFYEYNEIHLDSNSRDSGTNNQPTWNLPYAFQSVVGIKLHTAQIPFSYYVFNSVNNTFLLADNIAVNPIPTTAVVTITAGNYTSAALIVELQTQLNAASTALAAALGGGAVARTYVVTFGAATEKFTITSSNAEAFQLTFGSSTGHGGTSPRLYLGYAAGLSAAAGTGIFIAPNVANLSGPNYLLLVGSIGSRIAKNVRVNGQTSINPAVVAKIAVNSNPFGLIDYVDPSETYDFDFSDGTLQSVSLFFRPEFMRVEEIRETCRVRDGRP